MDTGVRAYISTRGTRADSYYLYLSIFGERAGVRARARESVRTVTRAALFTVHKGDRYTRSTLPRGRNVRNERPGRSVMHANDKSNPDLDYANAP